MTKERVKRLAFGWPACVLSIMWLSLFVQTDMAARLQGWVWPVVSPITVTKVEPVTVNRTPGSRITGYADIERGQCDYIDVSFELQGSDKSVNVTAFFASPAKIRGEGTQKWQALMVGVPPSKLDETHGEVRHECGIFPVVSPFFVPDASIIPSEVGANAQCKDGAYTTSTGPGTCSGHGGVREWI